MSTALVPSPKFKSLADYNIHGAHLSPTELVIENGMAEEEWQRLGDALHHLHGSTQWWIGDLIEFGIRTYGWDATFKLAATFTHYSKRYLYRIKKIARRFPPERRKAELSFFHYSLMVMFPPSVADHLLDEAAELGLSARHIWKLAKEEAARPEDKYKRKKVVLRLFPNTYNALTARAHGYKLPYFISQVLEEYLVGKPIEREPGLGHRSRAWKREVVQSIEKFERSKDDATVMARA